MPAPTYFLSIRLTPRITEEFAQTRLLKRFLIRVTSSDSLNLRAAIANFIDKNELQNRARETATMAIKGKDSNSRAAMRRLVAQYAGSLAAASLDSESCVRIDRLNWAGATAVALPAPVPPSGANRCGAINSQDFASGAADQEVQADPLAEPEGGAIQRPKSSGPSRDWRGRAGTTRLDGSTAPCSGTAPGHRRRPGADR
jgi:hypothetical protein